MLAHVCGHVDLHRKQLAICHTSSHDQPQARSGDVGYSFKPLRVDLGGLAFSQERDSVGDDGMKKLSWFVVVLVCVTALSGCATSGQVQVVSDETWERIFTPKN